MAVQDGEIAATRNGAEDPPSHCVLQPDEEPESAFTGELETATEEEIDQILQIGMREETKRLIHLLVRIKKLPSFYFLDAAKEAGISQEVYKSWRIKDWPTNPIRNNTRLCDMMQALIAVYKRVAKSERKLGETYWEALDRLKERSKRLIDEYDYITHNRLSQHVNVSHPTLDNILKMTEEVSCRPSHCPWELLDMMINAEKEIPRTPHSGVYTPTDIILERYETDLPEPEPFEERFKEQIVEPRGNCWHCGASWSNLIFDEHIEENPDYRNYICMQCSRPNVIKTPVIFRYGRCGHCGSPWHNLNKTGTDQNGNGVYACPHCSRENLIPPGKTHANIARREMSR